MMMEPGHVLIVQLITARVAGKHLINVVGVVMVWDFLKMVMLVSCAQILIVMVVMKIQLVLLVNISANGVRVDILRMSLVYVNLVQQIVIIVIMLILVCTVNRDILFKLMYVKNVEWKTVLNVVMVIQIQNVAGVWKDISYKEKVVTLVVKHVIRVVDHVMED